MMLRFRLGAKELVEMGRGCGPGKIRREGYTTKRGVKVGPKCVKDTGLPGKTPAAKRVLPRIEPGFLRGWSHAMPDARRHAAIERVVRAEGCVNAIRRLTVLANYTKNTSPSTHEKARADMEWVRNQGFCHLKSKLKGKY
jgi:uncharacterized protein DUF5771